MFSFCSAFLILIIVSIVVSSCNATHYMKKDHSLIKPYAGNTFNTNYNVSRLYCITVKYTERVYFTDLTLTNMTETVDSNVV